MLVAESQEVIQKDSFVVGDALQLIGRLKDGSVNTVVTSTPYWAMRVYDEPGERLWADGEYCSFGLEQTPEGFIRHSVEVLHALLPKIAADGSVWWNIMDSYNTRTQIRGSAVETLHAMQGKDGRSWKDHEYLRYSAGHSYLKDGEQCLIPQRIAQRAAQIGYYVKSTISWCKQATTPEPQQSRVSRNVEYILHLTRERTPKFNKAAYLELPSDLGGDSCLSRTSLVTSGTCQPLLAEMGMGLSSRFSFLGAASRSQRTLVMWFLIHSWVLELPPLQRRSSRGAISVLM